MRWRERLQKVFLASGGLALILAMALALTGVALWFAFPLPENLLTERTLTMRLADRHGQVFWEEATDAVRWQRQRTRNVGHALLAEYVVALEDQRFFEHSGVDVKALGRVLRDFLMTGRLSSGASTITQQVVKLGLDHRERSLRNKLQEMVLALKLEREESKGRILEAYVDLLDYGNRIRGVRTAATIYFGKEVEDLTHAEALVLAILPRSPTRLNPWRYPQNLAEAFRLATERLVRQGLVSGDQGQRLAERGLPIFQEPPRNLVTSHYAEAALAEYRKLGEERAEAAQVVCNVDWRWQQAVEQMLASHLHRVGGLDVSSGAVVVVENDTGRVRVMASQSPSHFVCAARTPRSVGSILKPFLYLEALMSGDFTAASLLPDTAEAARAVFPGYDPRNFNQRYYGPVRLREALGNSLNVPALVVLDAVGARRMYAILQDWGMSFMRPLSAVGAGFILGNTEASLLDVTAAYAGLARGGVVIAPSFLARTTGVWKRRAEAEACAIISDVLADDFARRASFGPHSALQAPVRSPVKTGTSSNFRDAWCVGSLEKHTVGVWAGNLDGRAMRQIFASRAAAPLWQEVVRFLVREGDSGYPRLTEGLTEVEVCKLTGLLPSELSPGVVNELFLQGSKPDKKSDQMLKVREGRAVLVLDESYAGWVSSGWNYKGARLARQADEVWQVVSPSEGQIFRLSEDLPAGQQAIRFAVDFEGAVSWLVERIGEEGSKQSLGGTEAFWQPEPGLWRIRARAGGEEKSVHIEVR